MLHKTLSTLAQQQLKRASSLHLSRAISVATPLNQQQTERCAKEDLAWEHAKDYADIPGPKPLPILGNTWRFLPVIGNYSLKDFSGIWRQMNNDYGEFVKLSGVFSIPDIIYAFDPNDIEKIYKMESHMPERLLFDSVDHYRRNYRQDIFKHAMGVVATKGEEWYRQRNILNPVMMQPRVIKQYVPVVEDIAVDFVKRLRRIRKDNKKITEDFLKEANNWSLESIAYIALDARLNCLSENSTSGKATELINATETIFRLLFELDFSPSIWRYVKTPKFYEMMKTLDTQLTISKGYIDEAIVRIEENKRNGTRLDKELSILEKLLEIDQNVAIVMALDMMLAGIDTTSNSLVNILYYLSTNKSAQDKLRDEIYSLLPDENSRLTDKNLDQLPYLKACVKEGARMFPVVPGGMRVLTKDSVVAGYRIKKGTPIMFPMMYISRLEKHFPRPDEFIPERWLRDNEDSELSYKKAHPFSVVPFGFGARSCIGRRFAELELEVALVQLVKNFDISWNGPPPKRVTLSVNYLKDFHFVFNDYKK